MGETTVTPPPASPDWERIEAEYRAGVLSLREIAALHPGTNHVAITRRAKKEGWSRDLAGRIQARADELVTRRAVTPAETASRAVTEREIVEANAERIAQVRGEHRADISRMRALVLRLLAECEAEAADPSVFAELGEILRSPDEKGQDKLNEAYQKAISLPQRIKGVKDLADTLKVLVGLEREAYGLSVDSKGPSSYEQSLRELAG